MTKKELTDIAFEIATGAVTTEILNQKEWEEVNTNSVLWVPLDEFGSEFTESLVSDITYSVINALEGLVDAD